MHKIAVIHDWLTTYAGAEKVLKQILDCFPQADLLTLVDFLPVKDRFFLRDRVPVTSFIQKLPFCSKKYRSYLPLMPLAIEQFELNAYDLIISSSHAVAKGVIVGPDQLHISYVHSPMRYAWDLQYQYLRESGLEKGIKGWVAKWLLHKMRMWDLRSSIGVDYFVANSHYIARRIRKAYRRESEVIYPPVDVEEFNYKEHKSDFYFTASRMVPYKKIDLIVDAFNQMPDKKLIVLGDGPDFQKIKARGMANIQFLGYQSDAVMKEYLGNAKAFVFAAEEDFGILPVEAQASGTPVIAFGKGGVLETIKGSYIHSIDQIENPTGVFYREQNESSLREAVCFFEANLSRFNSVDCRRNSEKFSTKIFQNRFKEFVERKWAEFLANKHLF